MTELACARHSFARVLLTAFAATVLLVAGCESAPQDDDGKLADRVPPKAVEDLAAGRPSELIVLLDEEAVLPSAMAIDPARPTAATRRLLTARADALGRVKRDLLGALTSAQTELRRDFDHLPLMVVRVKSLDALRTMLARPEVVRFYENSLHSAHLAEALPFIDQPVAQSRGYLGAGTSVAILDTGIDHTHPDFGSCQTPGSPGCRVLYAADTATNDFARDSDGHGSNVAGIVAGTAPGAGLISLDVFEPEGAYAADILEAINWCIVNRDVYNIVAMNMSLGGGAYAAACSNDIFAKSIGIARANGILSVVSSGNDAYIDKIASPACVPTAISVGAVYDRYEAGSTFSSCSDSEPVPDQVACFSNSSSSLTMLAPGTRVTAGGQLDYYGTSMAAPFVAGGVAVARSAFPWNSADDAAARLIAGGYPVTDHRNQITKPRLDLSLSTVECLHGLTPQTASVTANGGDFTVQIKDLSESGCAWWALSQASWITLIDAACQDCWLGGTGTATIRYRVTPNSGVIRTGAILVANQSFSVTQGTDTGPPTGTLEINAGAAATNQMVVTASVSAFDVSGVAQMCLSTTTTCSNWVPYATSAQLTLPTGNGNKTVRVWFRDTLGHANTTAAASAVIRLDTVVPTNGTVSVRRTNNAELTLSWTGFADPASGIAYYKVVTSTSAAPASCAAGTQLYLGTGTTFIHSGLANGTTYYYRVCAIDVAGNTSTGAAASHAPAADFTPPTGSVTIAGDPVYTRLATVTLALAATDDLNGVTQMCISNTAACSSWLAFAGTHTWTLSSGNGTKTISVWFRDGAGNSSVTAVTDTVIRDSTAPTGGTLTASKSDSQVALSWSGMTDALSGVDKYRLVFLTSASPASCSVGTVAYEGTNTSFVHGALNNGAIYYYRLCAIDVAGNMAAGVITNANPAPDPTPPGETSVLIQGGSAFTGPSAAVTLAFTATDPDFVSTMCISNTSTCSAWVPFQSSKPWTLTSRTGLKTVYVWFRDTWNNTSDVVTDTITLDQTVPAFATGSALLASAESGRVTLSWPAATDANSGLPATNVYRLVYGTTATPATCATGTVAYEGNDLAFVHTGLSDGTTYYYRLCAVDNVGNRSAGLIKSARPAPEYGVPMGTVSIAASYTNSTTGLRYVGTTGVALTLTASDAENTVESMCISNSTTCTAWEPFSTTKSWTLTSGSGNKTVYASFRDHWNNTSAAATAAIVLDATAPTVPSGSALTANVQSGQVSLSWPAATDASSGLATTNPYRLVFSTTATPATCATGTIAYEGSGLAFVHSSLDDGTTYYYRLCATDRLGNTSIGLAKSARPAPEYNVPTGSLLIGAGYTNLVTNVRYHRTAAVALTLYASDDTGIASMCISNTSTCTAWEPFSPTKNWTLTSGNGNKTVYVAFRDTWNNTSTTYSAPVTVDATAPVNGTLALSLGSATSGRVHLSWTGQSDASSGIAGYVVRYSNTAYPTNCSSGTALYSGNTAYYTHDALSGARYYYRMCTVDNVGNISTGATATTLAP